MLGQTFMSQPYYVAGIEACVLLIVGGLLIFVANHLPPVSGTALMLLLLAAAIAFNLWLAARRPAGRAAGRDPAAHLPALRFGHGLGLLCRKPISGASPPWQGMCRLNQEEWRANQVPQHERPQ